MSPRGERAGQPDPEASGAGVPVPDVQGPDAQGLDAQAPAGGAATGPARSTPRPLPTRSWEMTSEEQDMMVRFRRDFLSLLDSRVAKIEALVLQQQMEPAHVALLSLESSSAMVGRTALSAVVKELRLALGQEEPEQLDLLLARLAREAEDARRQLEGSGG